MHQQISAVTARLHASAPADAPSLAPFVGTFLAELDPDELAASDAGALADAIAAHANLGRVRSPGQVLVAIHTPPAPNPGSGRSWVQTVTTDSPFLVDSICAAIRTVGFDVDMLMHPVLGVERDQHGALVSVLSAERHASSYESWVQVALDRAPNAAESDALQAAVGLALADVAVAVADWPLMQQRTHAVAHEVRHHTPEFAHRHVDPEEAATFLEWLLHGHFTFLGAMDHDLMPDGSLRPVPGSELGILRDHAGGSTVSDVLAPSAQWPKEHVILVTKTIALSTVHRRANYDIVVVKRYAPEDHHGQAADAASVDRHTMATKEPIGERRLVGLFTSEAVLTSPVDTPMLRGKVAAVLERSGLSPSSYSGKELRSILTSHPRDELFAATEDELFNTVMGVLAIGERRRTRLFARYDQERAAWTCQVYLPRDQYNTDVRTRIQSRLEHAFHADGSTFTTQLSDARLARLVFTLPSQNATAPDIGALEREVVTSSRSWSDALGDALVGAQGAATPLASRYRHSFPPAYAAETPLDQAVEDVAWCERVRTSSAIAVRLHRNTSEDPDAAHARLSLYSPSEPIALADLLPVLSNLGLRVIDEKADEVEVEGTSIWIHDLGVNGPGVAELDPRSADAERISAAVVDAWTGVVDNDGFNQLVTSASMTTFQANVLRLYARHARQLGLPFTLEYVISTLLEHPTLAAALAERFAVLFDPDRNGTDRQGEAAALSSAFADQLANVPSLDHDRILRMLSAQIDASVRTNAYQSGTSTLAVKFETRRISEAPQPRPMFEIFVSSPRVEGVHLRMGPVARGGLRWSDRPEDFRTEVLGLMKAQAVKNAVIVPAGAKGGFIVRKSPPVTDRAAVQAEGIECYRAFVGSLLDITDNIVDGAVIPPARVIRHDGDDPYLVVAADKGTATFSDIANAISLERHHWLGDAFASGGSVGYDHKAMGITARGAWESVKRHFLRLGRDITAAPTGTATDSTTFTVIGIGDMSGDVFGNGMLLSDRIRLIAAFDHRHIFIDPSPDPVASLAERARLFALPRSSWDDYNRTLLSEGGGVWPRSSKAISLSPQSQAALGIGPLEHHDVSPTDVLRLILRAPVDLLWNGGIGTYIKASTETHAQVGDKANDAIRADATELRVSIVGEGGNLGVTQRGRIEFAARLRQEPLNQVGWINTDAIDNSAGVDTSDHEVNLKILLDPLVRQGRITESQRNDLLASLTDEVAGLVLADNIDQNRLLGNLLTEAPGMVDLHARYVQHLEERGLIDRALEALPSADGFVGRKAAGAGLTIPELSVLVAHTKLAMTEELAREHLADDPVFADDLLHYFPARIATEFGDAVKTHSLRHEIVATVLANRVVNRNGATFVYRMQSETHADVVDVVRAHRAASTMLDIDRYWAGVAALDGTVPDPQIVQLYLEADRAVERTARWLLRNRTLPLDVQGAIDAYQPALVALSAQLDELVNRGGAPGSDAEALSQRHARFVADGLPDQLARQGAQFEFATSLLDAVVVANTTGHPPSVVAGVLLALDDSLLIGRLRRRILRLPRENEWDALARSSLRDDLAGEHLALTRSVLNTIPPGASGPETNPAATHVVTDGADLAAELVASWATTRADAIGRHLAMVEATEHVDGSQLAALSVALRALRTLGASRVG